MSSNKGKIINHKGVQYVREKAENIGSCGECPLNTNFNEVCKYSRECELTGTILKLRKKEEENKKVFNPLCPKCHGKGWYFVDEWIGDLQGRRDCNCLIK